MIIRTENVAMIDRGGGIISVPLVTKESIENAQFTTGMSVYPAGTGAPRHSHNCDEQVTLIEGTGEVEIEDVVTPLTPYDSTYIRAGVEHAFRNKGPEPMRILWIYSSSRVTRTLSATGATVAHLSPEDRLGLRD